MCAIFRLICRKLTDELIVLLFCTLNVRVKVALNNLEATDISLVLYYRLPNTFLPYEFSRVFAKERLIKFQSVKWILHETKPSFYLLNLYVTIT